MVCHCTCLESAHGRIRSVSPILAVQRGSVPFIEVLLFVFSLTPRQASFDRTAGHQAAPGGQVGEAKAPPAAAGAGYNQLPSLVQEGGYPGRGGHTAQADMGRAPHAPQPPPPPSQAPQVPPAQPPAPQ
ncbi:unnamed protein product, partial [Prorocentrum cordatum]